MISKIAACVKECRKMAEAAREGRKSKEIGKERVGKYTMSVAVRLTSVEAHRIRRFEKGGLLQPTRTETRQRLFSDHGIKLIREIAKLEDQGINIPGIKVILEMKRRDMSSRSGETVETTVVNDKRNRR